MTLKNQSPKFLNGWTIKPDLIPEYKEFNNRFEEALHKPLINSILNNHSNEFSQSTITSINTKSPFCNKSATISYKQRNGLGRFYSCFNNSIITLPKKIKHTIFSFANYLDLDQMKGHPTIGYNIAKLNNIELDSFRKYINDTDLIFNEMANHYGVDISIKKNEDRLKWFFNLTIYGGSYDTWLKGLIDPTQDDIDDGFEKLQLTTHEPLPFMNDFKTDCNILCKLIISHNQPLIEKLNQSESFKDKPDWKKTNSIISYYLQIFENDALYHAFKFLSKNNLFNLSFSKYPMLSLEYDGLCFQPSKEITQDIIDKLNQYVFDKCKLNITYKIKPYLPENIYHDEIETYKQFLITEQAAKDAAKNPVAKYKSFEELAEEFNKKNCKIISLGCYISVVGDQTVFFKIDKMKVSYNHIFYSEQQEQSGKYVDKSFINKWLHNYDEVPYYDFIGIFPPGVPCPANTYNLWQPFYGEKLLENNFEFMEHDLNVFKNHIKVLCNHDELVTDYFIKWIAHMFQKPADKSTCISLISEEGAGKGSLMDLLNILLGKGKLLTTTKPELHCWGTFNMVMKDAFLVNLNEIGKHKTVMAQGEIKGLITDKSLMIYPKGKEGFEIISYSRWIVTTNSPDGAFQTYEGDRRNIIIESGSDLIKNTEYFNYWYKNLLTNNNSLATIYSYLKNIDLTEFYITEIPRTNFHKELIESNINPIELFIKHIIETNYYQSIKSFQCSELFSMYKKFCEEMNLYKPKNIQYFSRDLKKIDNIQNNRTSKGALIIFDIDKLKIQYNLLDLEIVDDEVETDSEC